MSPEYDCHRVIRLVSAAVLFGAVLSFAVAFFLPVYTDELGWKLIEGRMYLDGLQSVKLLPQCGNYAVPIPRLLLPFRYLDSLLYERVDDPIFIRVSGFLLGLAQLCIAWVIVSRILRRAITRWTSAVLVLSFATIGIMPFLLVMNRPEQILSTAILILALPLIFDASPPRLGVLLDILQGLIVTLFCGFVISEHPRGLFVLPLMLLFLFRFSSRQIIAWAGAVCISVIGFAALGNWSALSACSDPSVHRILMLENITIAEADHQLLAYLRALLSEDVHEPLRALYIKQFQFNYYFTSDMIPPASGWLAWTVRKITSAAFVGLFMAGASAFILAAAGAVRSRRLDMPVAALTALWAFWAASSIARVFKADYEEAVMMPVLVLSTVGSLWVARYEISNWLGMLRFQRLCRGAFVGLIGLALVNQATLLWNYAPWVLGAWTDPGYARKQKWSIVPFGYSRLRPQIVAAGAMCGLRSHDRLHHLVVDELTYYVFRSSFQPILATYIDQDGWGNHIVDYHRLLAGIGSQGLIARCQSIPTELRNEAKQFGQFCCLPSFSRGR